MLNHWPMQAVVKGLMAPSDMERMRKKASGSVYSVSESPSVSMPAASVSSASGMQGRVP